MWRNGRRLFPAHAYSAAAPASASPPSPEYIVHDTVPPAGLGASLPVKKRRPSSSSTTETLRVQFNARRKAMLDWWKEIRKPAVMRISVNPNDRVTAEKLVSCGLFDKNESNKAFVAFDRMRKRPKLPTVKQFFDAMRCTKSEFAIQVLLLPRQLTDRLLPAEVDSVEISFAEFSIAVWLLCSFDLATLAFSMMDTRGLGRVTRDQVREAVKTVYATGNKNLKARLDGNSKCSTDAKLNRLLDGFGLDLSKDDFLELTSKYHYLLLPAFQLQRSVRDTVFGPTVADWQRLEQRRRSVVAGRTVQQVIRHLASQLPDLQACVPNDTDIYKFECQKNLVLDHAVRAYREGNYQRAKTVYGHYERFDPKAHDLHQPDGKFHKSEALTIMSIDQTCRGDLGRRWR